MKGKQGSRVLFLSVIFFCCGTYQANAQYDHLLHKTYAERFADMQPFYRKAMDPALDSGRALADVHALARAAAENGDDDLLLETKLIVIYYYHARVDPATSAQLSELLTVAQKKNKRWLEAMVEDALGGYYSARKQYEQSFEHYLRLYNVTRDMSTAEFPPKPVGLCYFANDLYQFREYRTAIFFLREGLKDTSLRKLTAEIRKQREGVFLNGINSLGLCYRALDMLDSSSYYFRLGLQEATAKANETWVGISSGNLGENFFLQGVYEKAKPLLQKDADIARAGGDFGVASNALMILAEISMKEGDLKKAGEQLALARNCAYRSQQYRRLKKLYPILSKYYVAIGNQMLATTFLDSSLIVRDSLERAFNALYMVRAQQKVDLEKQKADMEYLRSQEKIRTLQRNGLVIIGILAGIIGLFIYKGQRRRYKAKNEQLKRATEDLAQASKELDAFTRSITEKNQMIELLQSQIGDTDSKVLGQLQRSTILTDEQWNEFRILFDKVHQGFLNRLKEKMPGLTPAETRFVALSKLKLTTKEMASTLGIGMDAVRHHRSRLRKKLSLNEEESLEKLFDNI